MKFKDKDGNVFEDVGELVISMCKRQNGCSSAKENHCPLLGKTYWSHQTCYDWAKSRPVEAALMMGYEVIMDDCAEKEESAENKKPLAEWTLRELKEWCIATVKVDACRNGGCPFSKICDLLTDFSNEDVVPGDWDLSEKPRFTDAELEQLRAVALLYGHSATARRSHNGEYIAVDIFSELARLNGKLLPSLKPGEEVRVKDYLGGE